MSGGPSELHRRFHRGQKVRYIEPFGKTVDGVIGGFSKGHNYVYVDYGNSRAAVSASDARRRITVPGEPIEHLLTDAQHQLLMDVRRSGGRALARKEVVIARKLEARELVVLEAREAVWFCRLKEQEGDQ